MFYRCLWNVERNRKEISTPVYEVASLCIEKSAFLKYNWIIQRYCFSSTTIGIQYWYILWSYPNSDLKYVTKTFGTIVDELNNLVKKFHILWSHPNSDLKCVSETFGTTVDKLNSKHKLGLFRRTDHIVLGNQLFIVAKDLLFWEENFLSY